MSIPRRRAPDRSRQSGLTLVGLLLIGALLFVVVIIAVKVVPTYFEYQAIRKTVTKAAQQGGETVVSIQEAFDKLGAVEDITSITGRDLVIEKRNGQMYVGFQYEKRIPLVGPASLVIDYRGSNRDK